MVFQEKPVTIPAPLQTFSTQILPASLLALLLKSLASKAEDNSAIILASPLNISTQTKLAAIPAILHFFLQQTQFPIFAISPAQTPQTSYTTTAHVHPLAIFHFLPELKEAI